MAPPIQYARTDDGVSIAHYAIGEGTPALVYLTPGSHLEFEWEYPEQRAWLEALARNRKLVRLDHRGSGLSDREVEFVPRDGVRDIEAVVRRLGLKRFALLGQMYSAMTAILYAAEHPESVSHLVLWNGYATPSTFAEASPQLQAARAAGAIDWPTFTEIISQHVTGFAVEDQAHRFAAYMRSMASGEAYLRFVDRLRDVDTRPMLRELRMPALVMQRRGPAFPTLDTAKELAVEIPDSRLLLFEGRPLAPWLGDSGAVLEAINAFLAEPSPAARPDGLTPREAEILALLAAGRSNQAIAAGLSLSARTVERHIGNIYLKIGAHNRAEATAFAFRNAIVPAS
jgi:pimeloyl-ACP methyl ester carboxylesterase